MLCLDVDQHATLVHAVANAQSVGVLLFGRRALAAVLGCAEPTPSNQCLVRGVSALSSVDAKRRAIQFLCGADAERAIKWPQLPFADSISSLSDVSPAARGATFVCGASPVMCAQSLDVGSVAAIASQLRSTLLRLGSTSATASQLMSAAAVVVGDRREARDTGSGDTIASMRSRTPSAVSSLDERLAYRAIVKDVERMLATGYSAPLHQRLAELCAVDLPALTNCGEAFARARVSMCRAFAQMTDGERASFVCLSSNKLAKQRAEAAVVHADAPHVPVVPALAATAAAAASPPTPTKCFRLTAGGVALYRANMRVDDCLRAVACAANEPAEVIAGARAQLAAARLANNDVQNLVLQTANIASSRLAKGDSRALPIAGSLHVGTGVGLSAQQADLFRRAAKRKNVALRRARAPLAHMALKRVRGSGTGVGDVAQRQFRGYLPRKVGDQSSVYVLHHDHLRNVDDVGRFSKDKIRA